MVMRFGRGSRAQAAAIGMVLYLGLVPAASVAVAAGGRHAAIVIDGNSGRVLMEEQADEPRYPASLTKMMTLYLAFEQFEQGRMRPDTAIKISQEAAAQQPSKLELAPGSTIAAMDAVKALITKSANDIAVALAEHMAGNERAFAVRMTEKARQLGMTRTTFRNASGLPDTGQVTTARDMVTLAMRIHDDFPKYYPLFALRSFSYNGQSHANHNTMLRSFEGTEGMKTGYIGASGFNVVTAVKRGPRHVFGAVFGGSSGASRNSTMRAALVKTLPHAMTTKSRSVVSPALVAAAAPGTARRPSVAITPAASAAPRPTLSASALASAQPIAPASNTAERVAALPAAPAPATQAPIAIAQVRRVAIAPRVKPETPAPAVPAAAPAAKLVPVALPQPAPPSPPARPAAAATTTALPPSTLQAQASALSPLVRPQAAAPQTVAALSPPSRLNGPSAAPPTPAAGSFHLQIGAFQSVAEAERALAAARARAAQLLGNAPQLTIPVQSQDRQLFRARFAGFSAQEAANICLELRRQTIDCFVMKGE